MRILVDGGPTIQDYYIVADHFDGAVSKMEEFLRFKLRKSHPKSKVESIEVMYNYVSKISSMYHVDGAKIF